MSEVKLAVRVEFGSLEDCRRAIFLNLTGVVLDERKRAKAAGSIAAALRDGGLIAGSVEQHYSAAQVAALLGRCPEYVVHEAKAGRFGRVCRDARGWLIPASGVEAWLADHTVILHRMEVAA